MWYQRALFKYPARCIRDFVQRLKLASVVLRSVHNQPLKHVEKLEDITHIRNIGIIAHIDAGKTTTTERMLYYSGFTQSLGNVDSGNTVTDFMEQERNRGITINAAAVSIHWKNIKINLIDTPGHVDFTIEVERALRVMDGSVIILDASAGVQAQTYTVWKCAHKYDIPCLVYLNKMDKHNANIEKSLSSIKNKLNCVPLLIQFPVVHNDQFTGVVDLVTMKKISWNDKLGDDVVLQHLTSDDNGLWSNAVSARSDLIAQVADLDETIAEYILNDVHIDKISVTDIRDAIRRVTLSRLALPVCLGSSVKNKGVQTLLDSISYYLPHPGDRHYDFLGYYDDLVSLAFKVIHDKFRGVLTFIRVYGGSLKLGSSIYNATRDSTEKVDKLMLVNANEYRDVRAVYSGNIACVAGFSKTLSGDTLVMSKASLDKAVSSYRKTHTAGNVKITNPSEPLPLTDSALVFDSAVLPGLDIPDPVFFCTIEPPSLAFEKQLNLALECLEREDPTFRVRRDQDTGQVIISGMGELHLEVIRDRILKEYNVDAHLGKVQVSYRETITESHTRTETMSQIIAGWSNEVSLTLSLHPLPSTEPFKQVEISHSREANWNFVKPAHIKSVNYGVAASLMCGPLLSFPVIGVKVNLHELTMKPRTTLPVITACASKCIKNILQSCHHVLLEPMMKLEVHTNEDYLTAVLGDISQRRGRIEAIMVDNDSRIVSANAPLSSIMGYSTVLRTITSGTAYFTMQVGQYETLTPEQTAKVIDHMTGSC